MLARCVDERESCDKLNKVLSGSRRTNSAIKTARLACENIAQPGVDDLDEEEVGLIPVHHRCSRIVISFDRIGLDQTLAEAVNCRAGNFVNVRTRCDEIAMLIVG